MHPWNDRSNGSACFPGLRECEKVWHSCTGLFTAAGCVCKCFARTYHGCGLQSLVSEEKEWEREGLIHFTPMWAHKNEHNSQHVRACVWAHERLRARVGVQFGRVADCWLAVSSFSSPFIFRTPGFSVLTEREVHNNTRERQIEEKKEREAVGLRKGGTSVSTFPHLNVFLHSWQQPTMSSQGEMGLEKEWKRTSKTNPGKWISALFSD